MSTKIAVMGMVAAVLVVIATLVYTHPNPHPTQYGFVIVDNEPAPAKANMFDGKRITLVGEGRAAFCKPRLAYGSHVTQRMSGVHDDTIIERILKKLRRPG